MQSSNGSVGSLEVESKPKRQAPFMWKSRTEGRDRESLILTSAPTDYGRNQREVAAQPRTKFWGVGGISRRIRFKP